ncbi:MAG: MucB/RseB C-terminal domain-containing protein [Burkholderiaceae bacterium]|jgi:sigma-E factor negative regulatory protein RseB
MHRLRLGRLVVDCWTIILLAASCLLAITPARAANGSGWEILQYAQAAAKKTNYQGIMIVQSGPVVFSSRVTHLSDAAGEYEHIETLDGQQKEWIRHNDDFQALIPENKLIRQQNRHPHDKLLGVLTANLDELAQWYSMQTLGSERIAGMDCQVAELVPKDAFRYGYRFWIEKNSHLLIRTQTLNDNQEVLEQVAFSELRLGPVVDKQKFKFKTPTDGWRVEQVKTETANWAAYGWSVKSSIPGFKKVAEIRRVRRNGKETGQILFSDGLAFVSVFLEPVEPSKSPSSNHIMQQGAVHSQFKKIADWNVMVMGAVPMTAIKGFLNSVELKN